MRFITNETLPCIYVMNWVNWPRFPPLVDFGRQRNANGGKATASNYHVRIKAPLVHRKDCVRRMTSLGNKYGAYLRVKRLARLNITMCHCEVKYWRICSIFSPSNAGAYWNGKAVSLGAGFFPVLWRSPANCVL